MTRVSPLRKPVKCPSCSVESKREFYPFCSKRCAEKDLHHWFAGSYGIASEDVDFAQEE